MAKNGSLSEGLAKFLDYETSTLTVNGAIGRNKTYCAGVDPKRRSGFRRSLRCWLHDQRGEYRAGQVGDVQHLANIERLSSTLSKSHGEILLDGRFHIGAAQKALNLYLKYCWARGLVGEPPHCPIDSIVLTNITKCPSSLGCRICATVTWTKIRTMDEYVHFVEKAREQADEKGLSLASWELGVWAAAKSAV